MTISELADKLETSPAGLVGKTYTGRLGEYDSEIEEYFVLCGDYILVVDFDRTILEVIER